MLIKFLCSFAGNDFVIEAGEVRDWDAAEAERFIKAGYAVPADRPVERAVNAPAETRAKKKGK
jgi:hypothetical protein